MATPAVNEQNTIQEFWRKRKEEIEEIEDFGERAIPMTRLRKLICAEKGKMMMSFDTPSFLTKACEIFVQEITFRAWMCAMSHNRGIIVDSDIAEAIASTQSYDFLKDVLLDNQEEHNSEPCPNPTKKYRYGLENHPSTSQQQPPSHQYQMPQFTHQLTSCSSYASIRPPPLPPTNVHDMTLPLPFLPQEVPTWSATTATLPTPIVSEVMISHMNYISGDLGSFQNNINNNVSDFGVINPPQVLLGAPPYIPNNHNFMSMVPSTCEYDIGSASTSIVAAQNGGVEFHSPCNIPNGLQLSSPSTVANNIGPTSTSIIELNNILPRVNEAIGDIQAEGTLNTYGMIDPEATLCVSNSQQQHQEGEAIVGADLNVVRGSLDAEVATTDVGRNNYDVSLEEFDMVDDSLLDEYWDAFLLDEDPATWPDLTCTGDVLPLHIDMPDLHGFSQEPHLLDAIVRSASTGSR
ncbi:hypothetical protein BS78_08G094200 [Paspalum vaginatum]|nr:hypothetical protein BS78_08G094200 [Paspalum vaginatum]